MNIYNTANATLVFKRLLDEMLKDGTLKENTISDALYSAPMLTTQLLNGSSWDDITRNILEKSMLVIRSGKYVACVIMDENVPIGCSLVSKNLLSVFRHILLWSKDIGIYWEQSDYFEGVDYTKLMGKIERSRLVDGTWISLEPEIRKHRVFLDPGHSDAQPGATGRDRTIREYDLNVLQANTLKTYLEDSGLFRVDIYDPAYDDPYDIGRKSDMHDVFISLHLNAFNREEHYAAALIDPRFFNEISEKIASEAIIKVAEITNNRLVAQAIGYLRGIYPRSLAVLRGAATAGTPVAFLTEIEFVDDEKGIGPIKKRIDLAMKAIAGVLIDYSKSGSLPRRGE